MTWDEFKKEVDRQLNEKEIPTTSEICWIDIHIYGDGRFEVQANSDGEIIIQ